MISEAEIVWRVENAKGWGPYRPNTLLYPLTKFGFNKANDKNHPGPLADEGLSNQFRLVSQFIPAQDRLAWRFGFADINQYLFWFDREDVRDLLAQNNFYLVAYLVAQDRIFYGNKQVCFFSDNSVIKVKQLTVACNDPKLPPVLPK